MAENNDIPQETLDELERRIAVKLLRYFLASIGTIVLVCCAGAAWKTQTDFRISTIEQTVQADEPFKSKVQTDIAVLQNQNETTLKAIDRMDNKLDRVIRVYEVPK